MQVTPFVTELIINSWKIVGIVDKLPVYMHSAISRHVVIKYIVAHTGKFYEFIMSSVSTMNL